MSDSIQNNPPFSTDTLKLDDKVFDDEPLNNDNGEQPTTIQIGLYKSVKLDDSRHSSRSRSDAGKDTISHDLKIFNLSTPSLKKQFFLLLKLFLTS